MVTAFAELPDAARLSAVPVLAGAVRASALTGGITNRNYRVQLADRLCVARVSDPASDALAINRDHEFANSVAAAASGVGAPVLEYCPQQGVLVVEWIDGVTYTEADVRQAQNLPRIASAVRQLHAGPTFVNRFNMFDIQAQYLQLVIQRGFRLPPRYESFAEQVQAMAAAMAVDPEPLVPCNNDLLAANFIDTGDRVRIIDYEYAGNNEASFELGNIWIESNLAPHLLPVLVEHYWQLPAGSPELVAKTARARLWALMSKYGWMLWASIQDGISDIEFDFWGWGMDKYERAVAEFDSPEFDAWLAAIA